MHVWMAHQASGRVRAHGRASAFSSLPIVIDLEAYSPVTLRQNSALSIEWQLAVLQSDREPLSTGRHRPNAVAYAGPLAAIRTIIQRAPFLLRPGGSLWLEHGFDQAEQVRALLTARGMSEVRSVRDLAGIERISGGVFAA